MIDEIQRIKRNLKDSEDRLSYLQDRFRGELDGEFTFDEVLEKIEKLYGEKYENQPTSSEKLQKILKKRRTKDARRSKGLQTGSKRESKTGKSNK